MSSCDSRYKHVYNIEIFVALRRSWSTLYDFIAPMTNTSWKVQEGWLIIGQLSASYRHSTYINYWDGFSHKYTYVIKWKRENCGRFILLFFFSYLRNLKISTTLFQNLIFGLIVSIENIHPDFINKNSIAFLCN